MSDQIGHGRRDAPSRLSDMVSVFVRWFGRAGFPRQSE